jgi:hypothetical protein
MELTGNSNSKMSRNSKILGNLTAHLRGKNTLSQK